MLRLDHLPTSTFVAADGSARSVLLREERDKIRSTAAYLKRVCGPGTAVGLMFRSGPDLVINWLACLLAELLHNCDLTGTGKPGQCCILQRIIAHSEHRRKLCPNIPGQGDLDNLSIHRDEFESCSRARPRTLLQLLAFTQDGLLRTPST